MIPKKLQSYLLLFLLVMVLGTVIFIRIRLLSVPLERDEGEFAYIGQLILKGVSPFAHAYTMKIPGVGILYALFMLMFGQTATAVHIGLLLVNLACILMVFFLARRLLDLEGALAATATFAVLSLSQSVLGLFAHATHFVILFALAAFLLLLRSTNKGNSRILVFAGGLCFGCSFLMKQHAIFFFMFAVVYLARQAFRAPGKSTREVSGDIALLLLGLIVPYALIAVWMSITGTFSQFWFWTVTYARDYATGTPLSSGLITLFFRTLETTIRQFPLWLAGIAGGGFIFTRHHGVKDRFFLAGFFCASLLAICPGFYFREHYYVMLLPAVALLTGAALQSASFLPYFTGTTLKQALPALTLLLAVGYGLLSEKSIFFSLPPTQVSRETYGTNPFPEAMEISRYIKENSSPDDRIAVLGSEPEIYFYADRLSASGYIYMYGLTEKQSNASKMQRELIKEIERARPAYVVLVNIQSSWLVRSSAIDTVLEWCEQYVNNGYELVGIADIADYNNTHYEWGHSAASYKPVSDSYITVFKRKS